MNERTARAVELEPLPKRPNPWRLFTAFNSSEPRWPGALRAAIAVTVPGMIALLLGHPDATVLIASGGFIVIYGEGHPYRARIRIMAWAAAMLVAGATVGAFVGTFMWDELQAGGSHWWLMLSAVYTVIIATVGTYVQNALRLRPPGVFFIVMVAGGSTMMVKSGLNPIEVGGWAIVGALSAILVGMSGALVNPHGPERQAVITADRAVAVFEAKDSSLGQHHRAQQAVAQAWSTLGDAGIISGGAVVDKHQSHLVERTMDAHRRLARRGGGIGFGNDSDMGELFDEQRLVIPHTRPSIMYRLTRSANRHSHAYITAEKVLMATLLSATVGIALGFDRPDWAVVSALLMIQWGPDRIPGQVRGLHRLVGSLVGIGLYGVFHLLEVDGLTLLLALAVCQFGAEFFVTKNYAFTVIFTTPLALLMGDSLQQPLGDVFWARTAEVAISIVFGSLLLWLWRPSAERAHHYRLIIRVRKAMGSLLGALLVGPPSGAKEERRDLQYELLSERRAINSLAMDHPDDALEKWADHVEAQTAGYAMLEYCNARNDDRLTPAEVAELAARVPTPHGPHSEPA